MDVRPATPRAVDPVIKGRLEIPRDPRFASVARAWIVNTLTGWDIPEEVCDTAELLVSELFGNACLHVAGPGPATITAALWLGSIRITVSDPGTDITTVRPADDGSDEHNRGLYLLDVLAASHGVERTSTGKSVWFELAGGAP